MANSRLEELLYEIHEKGLFDEVLEIVREIRKEGRFISTSDLYEMAYEMVLKKKFEKNISEFGNDT